MPDRINVNDDFYGKRESNTRRRIRCSVTETLLESARIPDSFENSRFETDLSITNLLSSIMADDYEEYDWGDYGDYGPKERVITYIDFLVWLVFPIAGIGFISSIVTLVFVALFPK